MRQDAFGSDREVKVVRSFKAPRDLVFKAELDITGTNNRRSTTTRTAPRPKRLRTAAFQGDFKFDTPVPGVRSSLHINVKANCDKAVKSSTGERIRSLRRSALATRKPRRASDQANGRDTSSSHLLRQFNRKSHPPFLKCATKYDEGQSTREHETLLAGPPTFLHCPFHGFLNRRL